MQNLRGAEVWRAGKYANGQVGTTVEASKDKIRKQADSATQKEGMLRRE